MQKRSLALAGAVLFMSACLGVTDPSRDLSYGFVLIDAETDGNRNYFANIVGTFFWQQRLQMPSVTPIQDQCQLVQIPLEDQEITLPPSAFAGDSLDVRLSGNRFPLLPILTGNLLRYYPAGFDVVPFRPGDTVDVRVPGSTRFPAWEILAMTAEEFTFTEVSTAPEPGPLQLSWTPPLAPGSKMLVALRYSTSTFPDRLAEQIFCELFDDGSHAIPAALTAGWRNAPDDVREAQLARWRVTIDDRPPNAMLVVSTFLVPTPLVEGEEQ